MSQERKTSIEQRAQVEQARMKIEGFDIPRGHWRDVELSEDMTRQELRRKLAEGILYTSPSGHVLDGNVAVEVMEATIRKLEKRNAESDKWQRIIQHERDAKLPRGKKILLERRKKNG